MTSRPVALLFPGQGAQHPRMAAGLYGSEPVFTTAVDTVLTLFGGEHGDLRADWLGERPRIGIDDVRRAQPLLFTVEYALAETLRAWGVLPAALLGHSAGELVAATVAGVVDLPDAVGMVAERVRHAARVPAGGMLAVAAPAEALRPYLSPDVVIAAVNARRQTMLAGTAAALLAVEQRLRRDDVTVRTVPATAPFHSPAMAPVARANRRAFGRVRLRPPVLPLYSGYTGGLLSPTDAVDPAYWARQVTDPVLFGPALERLLATGDRLVVEVGPGQALSAFARRTPAVASGRSAVLALSPVRPSGDEADRAALADAAARLVDRTPVLT